MSIFFLFTFYTFLNYGTPGPLTSDRSCAILQSRNLNLCFPNSLSPRRCVCWWSRAPPSSSSVYPTASPSPSKKRFMSKRESRYPRPLIFSISVNFHSQFLPVSYFLTSPIPLSAPHQPLLILPPHAPTSSSPSSSSSSSSDFLQPFAA